MIASLGDIVFEVNDDHVRTFSGMTYTTGARYATHNRIGDKPLLEFTGQDIETLSITIKLSAFNGLNPRKEMRKINDTLRDGTPLRLVIGKTQFGRYRWVITKAANKLEHIDNKGNILSITVTLSLSSYFKR